MTDTPGVPASPRETCEANLRADGDTDEEFCLLPKGHTGDHRFESVDAPVASGTPKEVVYQSVSLGEARKRLEEAVASVRAAEEAYERAKRITQKDLRFEVDV